MYQGIYDYANRHRMKQDLFVGNANWKKGSKAFVRPIKERKPFDSKAYSVPPHDGAAKYPGLYSYASMNFVQRDLVLEAFETRPWQPLPGWVSRLTRGPRSFRTVKKVPQLA